MKLLRKVNITSFRAIENEDYIKVNEITYKFL